MTPSRPPADWQLPPGVNRGLWDYLHNADLASGYDAGLVGSSLFTVDQAFVQEHLPGPARLIDLGCGTGRLLVTLARRGWRTLGVDLSPEMLRVARANADAAGVTVDLLQANLVELTPSPITASTTPPACSARLAW
ncbi:MAG: methyltransferase domain-containing protein [Gemmataceae bacterium]